MRQENRSRLVQILGNLEKRQGLFMRVPDKLWRSKRRAEALPVAQTDIPREHVMLKFKDEDAEAVMAKALEGGSDSEKGEALFPVPKPFPGPLEIPGETKKKRWK